MPSDHKIGIGVALCFSLFMTTILWAFPYHGPFVWRAEDDAVPVSPFPWPDVIVVDNPNNQDECICSYPDGRRADCVKGKFGDTRICFPQAQR